MGGFPVLATLHRCHVIYQPVCLKVGTRCPIVGNTEVGTVTALYDWLLCPTVGLVKVIYNHVNCHRDILLLIGIL